MKETAFTDGHAAGETPEDDGLVAGDGGTRHRARSGDLRLNSGDRGRRRRWVVVVVTGIVIAGGAGTGIAAQAGLFRGSGQASASGASNVPTATVTRRSLTQQTSVNATLGYAGSYPVTGRVTGTITWLPAAGQVIRQGQVVYRVDNGTPVVLLYGSVPDWRALSEGATGQDVSQLNHDLVALGYADSGYIAELGWDYFSWETRYGLQQLQSALGISDPSGALPLGQAVFEPGALRVITVSAQLGNPGQGPVLTATSTTAVVTISLDPSLQAEVKDGDTVTVTMPDGTTTAGVVSSVGTVATSSSGSGGSSGSGSSATIPVRVKLTDPKAAAGLDQAQVTVNITTGSVSDALVVPVTALVAQSGGGYAVEEVTASGGRRLVPVTPGLLDNVDGLVQVTGSGLAAGQRVVVPSS
jgi:hypothetical protein